MEPKFKIGDAVIGSFIQTDDGAPEAEELYAGVVAGVQVGGGYINYQVRVTLWMTNGEALGESEWPWPEWYVSVMEDELVLD